MDTELKIVAAAERLFAERGYAGTRTAEIARAAKVTERTLFKHFPDKETLLARVLQPALLAAATPPPASAAPFAVWFETLLRQRLAAARRVAEFEGCERLFALWHVMHIPLFVMMLIAGFVHVIAVHIY